MVANKLTNFTKVLHKTDRASEVLVFDGDGNPSSINPGGLVIGTATGTQPVSQALDKRGVMFKALRSPTDGDFDLEDYLETSTKIQLGAFCHTLGYYEPGDGGGNDYEIVAASTGTDDGGSFIDLAGSGLQAKGLFARELDARTFGAKNNSNSFDNYACFTSCLKFIKNNGGGTLVIDSNDRSGFFGIKKPVVIYSDITIEQKCSVLNYNEDTTTFWDKSCWFIGAAGGFTESDSLFNLPSEKIAQAVIPENSFSVIVTNPENYEAGDVICVESVERLNSSIYPNYAILNTVERISGNTLVLKYPFEKSMGAGGVPNIYKIPTDPDDSPLNAFRLNAYDGPFFVAKNVSLQIGGGAVCGATEAITKNRRSTAILVACYESEISGGVAECSRSAFIGNPFARCTVSNIDCIAQEQAVELAYLTHNSFFDKMRAIVVEGVRPLDDSGRAYAMRIGSEGGCNNTFHACEGLFLRTDGQGAKTNLPAVGLPGGGSWIDGVVVGSEKPQALSGSDLVVRGGVVSGGQDAGIGGSGTVILDCVRIVDKERERGSIDSTTMSDDSVITNCNLGSGYHKSHRIYDNQAYTRTLIEKNNKGSALQKSIISYQQKNISQGKLFDVSIVDFDILQVNPWTEINLSAYGNVAFSNRSGSKSFYLDIRCRRQDIVDISDSNPVAITLSEPPSFVEGDSVYIENIEGSEQLNNRWFVVASISGNSFNLEGVDGLLVDSYISGGSCSKSTKTSPVTILDNTPLSGIEEFKVSANLTGLSSPFKLMHISLRSGNFREYESRRPSVDLSSTGNRVSLVAESEGDMFYIFKTTISVVSKNINRMA